MSTELLIQRVCQVFGRTTVSPDFPNQMPLVVTSLIGSGAHSYFGKASLFSPAKTAPMRVLAACSRYAIN